MQRNAWTLIASTSLLLSLLAGCSPRVDETSSSFFIISGSENQSIEPMIQEFAKKTGLSIEITYAGSIDIMRELALGKSSQYDAVWPANQMWIQLGDTTGATSLVSSIYRSPVVLGVKKSVAEHLGWVGADVFVDDILAAAESGQLQFMMSNPSQSDSGAAAYLGFLYAFAGHPNLLTSTNLQDPTVREKTKRILGTVGRSAGSSGLLKTLFLQDYDTYDGMVNYESVLIETNQELVNTGREPLFAIYPVDGTAIADSPLAFINKGDTGKLATFNKLKEFLLSEESQAKLLQTGRRTGLGINPKNTDPAVFNPDWGIDPLRILTPIKIPEASVLIEALTLYQTVFRKPSFTVFALDFSGSMVGEGETQLKAAMRFLLDQDIAKQYLLQASPEDVTIVITFNDKVLQVWQVNGNSSVELLDLATSIDATKADGGTDIYSPIIQGLLKMKEQGTDGFFPAVVLLTDGRSQSGKSFGDLKTFVETSGMTSVPVFAITFGDASPEQLEQIAALTSGAVYDGRTDLAAAFRKVRGNN